MRAVLSLKPGLLTNNIRTDCNLPIQNYFNCIYCTYYFLFISNCYFIIEDKQDLVEDCYICRRPNRIVILTAKDEGGPSAEARLTDE